MAVVRCERGDDDHRPHNQRRGRTDLPIPIYSFVLLAFFVYCYPIAVWTKRHEARYAER